MCMYNLCYQVFRAYFCIVSIVIKGTRIEPNQNLKFPYLYLYNLCSQKWCKNGQGSNLVLWLEICLIGYRQSSNTSVFSTL